MCLGLVYMIVSGLWLTRYKVRISVTTLNVLWQDISDYICHSPSRWSGLHQSKPVVAKDCTRSLYLKEWNHLDAMKSITLWDVSRCDAQLLKYLLVFCFGKSIIIFPLGEYRPTSLFSLKPRRLKAYPDLRWQNPVYCYVNLSFLPVIMIKLNVHFLFNDFIQLIQILILITRRSRQRIRWWNLAECLPRNTIVIELD